MDLETLKSKVVSGVLWKLAERFGVQGLGFAVQIVMARMLFPGDYAIVALVGVVLLISDVLLTGSFSTSLVQKKEVDDTDLSSVFYLSLGLSVLIYGILFITSPLFADFYDEPRLLGVLRCQALILVVSAFRSAPTAVLTRNMQFQKGFHANAGGAVASGIVGITLAWAGLGVWSLVFSQLAGALVMTILLWGMIAWRPIPVFSWNRIGTLFAFGWKLTCACLLEAVYSSLRTLFIGKIFTKDVLGYYNRGDSLPQLVSTSLDATVSSVMLPALSACQDDRAMVRGILRRSLVSSCFVVFPAMLGLAAVSEPVVGILLTEKWSGCVAFMQICCLGYALFPLQTSNIQAINALGRSDLFLRQEILKKVVGVAIFLASLPFGVYALVASGAVFSAICTVINAWPTWRLVGYSPWQQWRDVFPSLSLALIMGGVTWSVTLLSWNAWATLVVQLLLGVSVYLGGAWLLRFECLTYLVRTLQGEGRGPRGGVPIPDGETASGMP